MLTWQEICARRLDRHFLSGHTTSFTPTSSLIAEVVSAMCGAHAQVLSAAELSIAIRLPAITRDELRAALWTDRSLVKTRGPRGTIHLLPARDLPLWTGALSALPPSRSPFPADIQMSPEQIEKVIEAIGESIEQAELTVEELTEAIVARTGSWAGDPVMEAFQGKWPRWRQIKDLAANRGVLCFGPNRGRKVTYTSPRRWFPGFQPADGQAALVWLVKRYLYAYGPATPGHFARWLSTSPHWTAELFNSLSTELEQVEMDSTPAWVVPGDAAPPAAQPQSLRLLPYFDAYTVGCHPRHLLFPGRAAERALAAGQGGNYPVLLIDGIVTGIWHQRRSGRKLDITVEPFNPLSSAQRQGLDEQIERLGQFLEARPRLTIGPVTAGPHA